MIRTGELLDAARERTGLTDYGDEWFTDPLAVLVEALNTEARLSELGLALTRRRLAALLADRLRLHDLRSRHPEIASTEVTVVAAICGLPRTGSTLLHRMLAASPGLTATLSWETSYPLPFPGEGPDAAARKARARERAKLFLDLSPDFADIHPIEWDAPEEDVILLDRTFVSMSFDSFYAIPSYGTWLRATDQAPAYRELREWLRVLQWQDPGRRGTAWVLKSPHHLTAAGTVLDTFPGAKIVMTHRSPVSAVPSYASMVCSIGRQYSDDVDPVALGRYWSERFAATLRGFAGVRRARPERFVDVRYDELVADPVGQACRVLGELGVPPDAAALKSYMDRHRGRGSHAYTPADFGLSAERLARDFAFYTEEYL